MQSSALRPTLLDNRHKFFARDRWRGISFKLSEQRGNVRELTERHRPLCGDPGQQTTRRWDVGLRFALQQRQSDFSGGGEGHVRQLSGKAPNRKNVALGKRPLKLSDDRAFGSQGERMFA